MEKILVSACLLGEPVRHNGAHKRSDDQILQRWIQEGRVVAVCPEIAGGLPVPRPAAEIAGGADGSNVLSGDANVFDVPKVLRGLLPLRMLLAAAALLRGTLPAQAANLGGQGISR